MTTAKIKQQQRFLRRENARFGKALSAIPRSDWPRDGIKNRIALYRSCDFLVQVYSEVDNIFRLTVNRTEMRPDGGWKSGISWDDLQRIKDQCGYGEFDAVEVFPASRDVVNVANMRHLWVLPEPVAFKWTKEEN